MFWRRKHEDIENRHSSRKSNERPDYMSASTDSNDDLARLQRELGIQPIQDSDVQADLDLLIADTLETMDMKMDQGNRRTCLTKEEKYLEDELWRNMGEETLDHVVEDALEAGDDWQCCESQEELNDAQTHKGMGLRIDHSEEVTEEDMHDPEFLSQLEAFGLRDNRGNTKDDNNTQIASLLREIKEIKIKAVTLKKQNNLDQALQAFRELKILEQKLALFKKSTYPKDVGVNNRDEKYSSPHEAKEEDDVNPKVVQSPQTKPCTVTGCVDDHRKETEEIAKDQNSSSKDSNRGDSFRNIPQSRNATESDADNQNSSIKVEDTKRRLDDAKREAIELKRNNDIQGAVKVMRQIIIFEARLRQEECLDETGSIDDTKPIEVPDVPPVDKRYFELERLLVKFTNDAMLQSKKWLPINRSYAAFWVKQRNRYVDGLKNLRMGLEKDHNQNPPPFTIQRHSQQIEKVLPNVSENEIRVEIRSLHQLCQLAGKEVFVKFCLNVPSSNPIEGKTGNFYIPSTPPYACKSFPSKVCTQFSFPIKRNRGLQRLFDLKKATFEVWRPSTLFRSAEMVARAYLALSPLNGQCEIRCGLPFVNPNRRPTGGDVEVVLQLRTPLREKETETSNYEILTIKDSSVMSSPPTENSILSAATPQTFEMQNRDKEVEVDGNDDDFDPHSVDLIISYDVIEEEIKEIKEKPEDQRNEGSELRDRMDSLSLKKQLLEIEMESGRLTLENYLEQLKSRIVLDHAVYKKLQQQKRFTDAERVMQRIRIMKEETKVDPNDLP